MLKIALTALLLASALAASPSLAAKAKADVIGAGCTLNPFTHTMRCVKF